MAEVVVSGSYVITASATSGAQQPQTDSLGVLKKGCAEIVRGGNRSEYLSLAGAGILRCIDMLNMTHFMRFGRKSASDATIVDGTATYALAADYFAMSDVQLIDSDSNVDSQLEYVDWHEWNRNPGKQDATGKPWMWTVKNSFDDEQIILYPTPDASAAADFTLRMTYFERIARPSTDSDIIDAPRDLSLVLCLYSEFYLLDITSDNEVKINRKFAEYEKALRGFIHATERQPDAINVFSVPRDEKRRGTTNFLRGSRTFIFK